MLKKEISKIDYLNFHFKILGEEDEKKKIIMIRLVEINEIENWKTIANINKTKSYFFDNSKLAILKLPKKKTTDLDRFTRSRSE